MRDLENKSKLKVTSTVDAPNIAKKALNVLKRVGVVSLAAIIISTSTPSIKPIAKADGIVEVSKLTDEEKGIVQTLLKNGCDEQTLLKFKEYIMTNYASQSESDRKIMTEEECELLGVVAGDGWFEIPEWWDEESLRSFKKEVGSNALGNSMTSELVTATQVPLVTPVPTPIPTPTPTSIPVQVETYDLYQPTIDPNYSIDGIPEYKGLQIIFEEQPLTPNYELNTYDSDLAARKVSQRNPLTTIVDITDENVINSKIQILLDDLNRSGIYNINTNLPYTFEELKNIVLYIGGAYVPKVEEEANTMWDEFLYLAGAYTNWDVILYGNAYFGGEKSFANIVSHNAKNAPYLHIVDTMLIGESSAYPYLKWLEDHLNGMIHTTDLNEMKRLFEEAVDSLLYISFGEGYVLDGKIYTKNDFLGLDRISSGNVLQLLVYIIEMYKVEATKDLYYMTDQYLSAYGEEQVAVTDYWSIMEQFNFMCADDLINQIGNVGYLSYDGIKIEQNGDYINDEAIIATGNYGYATPYVNQGDSLTVRQNGSYLNDEDIVATGIYGHNFSYVNQLNTINKAKLNYEQSISLYNDDFGLVLK